MDEASQVKELRDCLMRCQVVLKELIEANPPEDVARELAIYDQAERLLDRNVRVSESGGENPKP